MGVSAKTALGKTTSAVAAVFSRNREAEKISSTDPLSLGNRPKKVGPEIFVANGQLWESTGDHGKAMESYTKALESEPNDAPALTSIARLHFREGKYKQAADFFRRAIEQNPEDAGLHNDLGLTLSKLNDHAGSTKSLEKALELAPGTSRYANNLASIKFEAGDSTRAYQVLEQNNKAAVAHFNMAYLHFKNGQTTEARNHLTEALREEPSAASDPAVQRAVERSREMLAQIDGSTAPIAQSAPQAKIAGGQFFDNASQKPPAKPTNPPAKPTNPSVTPQANVTPPSTAVAPIAPPPATGPIAPPPAIPAISSPPSDPPPATAISAITPPPATAISTITPPPSDSQPTAMQKERPRPIKPEESEADALPPAFPFALPESFKAP
jgi:Tfp pilus assembly protein PilF